MPPRGRNDAAKNSLFFPRRRLVTTHREECFIDQNEERRCTLREVIDFHRRSCASRQERRRMERRRKKEDTKKAKQMENGRKELRFLQLEAPFGRSALEPSALLCHWQGDRVTRQKEESVDKRREYGRRWRLASQRSEKERRSPPRRAAFVGPPPLPVARTRAWTRLAYSIERGGRDRRAFGPWNEQPGDSDERFLSLASCQDRSKV